MNKTQTFREFLATQSPQVELGGFVVNLVLAAVLAWLLGELYARCGRSLSNRRAFARNFLPIATTTMLVITIVKSSLALSLGLVGALSIVRFRAAIKEPEELSYLFLAIAIGLGLGADQRSITLAAVAVIGLLIAAAQALQPKDEAHNLHVSFSGHADLQDVVDALKKHAAKLRLSRVDEAKDHLEASFLVEYDGFEQFQKGKAALRKIDDKVRVSFLDNTGLS